MNSIDNTFIDFNSDYNEFKMKKQTKYKGIGNKKKINITWDYLNELFYQTDYSRRGGIIYGRRKVK